MKHYINIDRIPNKVDWRKRQEQEKQKIELTLNDKINRIERLARKLGIKIGG